MHVWLHLHNHGESLFGIQCIRERVVTVFEPDALAQCNFEEETSVRHADQSFPLLELTVLNKRLLHKS